MKYFLFRFVDIPSNSTEEDMLDMLEAKFNENMHQTAGKLNVKREGTCFGYCWTITWISIGGDKQPLQMINQSLNGLEVSTSMDTIQDGGIMFGPLTGEFLQVAETTPQVSEQLVFINLSSVCY